MDIVTLLQAALLGVVEGLTEFIPVSSTGHLILLVDLLGFKAPPGKLFEIVIQFGSILAVCWLYRQKLFHLARTLPISRKSQHTVLSILLAFLPAMVIGALAHDFIKHVLFSPWVVSVSLVLGGVVILLIERCAIRAKYHHIEEIPLKTSLFIGIGQVLAMVPGVSRSGATIMGALMLKVDRKLATEFSFLLAIPTMLAATCYDVFKNRHDLSFDNVTVIAVGFVFAFISAMMVVRTLIKFVGNHGFTPFAIYRIIIGTLMLAVLLTGHHG